MVLNWDVVIDPPQELLRDESIFADKAYVAEWVSRLPLAASGKAAEGIRVALGNVTSHELPYAARLYFLEQTSPIITSLTQGLLQSIHHEGIPLQEKTADKAKLVLDILALKVIGYRQIIEALTGSMFAGGLRRRQLMGSSMLRVMELLGQMFEIYRHASTPTAPGLWRLFNRYYAIAEADKQLDSRFGRIQGGAKTTIATLFKTQVLLDALNYYDLRHYELEQARELLTSLAPYVSIGEVGDAAQPYHFCFRIDEDAPPSRFAPERKRQCQSSAQRRVLDLEALMGKLKKLQAQTGSLGVAQAANQHVARKLFEGWHVTGDGRDERKDTERPIRVAFGLSNIVATLAKEYEPEEPPAPEEEAEIVIGQHEEVTPLDAGIDGLDLEAHSQQMEEDRDEWSVVPYAGGERDSWSEEYRKEVALQVHDARLVNESAGGFGIALSRDMAASRFKAGELVALYIDGEWVLASVRWVRMGTDSVSMGLARLGIHLYPFSLVVSRSHKESQPQPVLLLKYRSGESAIVLHNLSLRSEQKVSFAGSQTLSAESKLESTPSYVCYRIDDEVYDKLYHDLNRMMDERANSAVPVDQTTLEQEWEKLVAERGGQQAADEPSGYDAVMDDGFDKIIAHTRNSESGRRDDD
ncbi:MAG: hypothetical protein ACQETD_11520 [Pseudomonadota bacterium]